MTLSVTATVHGAVNKRTASTWDDHVYQWLDHKLAMRGAKQVIVAGPPGTEIPWWWGK